MSVAYVLPCCGVHSRISHSVGTCSWIGKSRLRNQQSLFSGKRVRTCLPPRKDQEGSFRCPPKALFSGGGIFGVGTSEVVVIIAVGWLLLGPEKLYSLARDTGKFLGELRRTANDAREQFSEALELDILEAETKKLSEGTIKKEVKVSNNAEREEIRDQSTFGNGVAGPETPLNAVESSSQEAQSTGASSEFLDQLRRVADPDQVAPTEVPDLQMEIEELEVERLEREYKAAKERLELRKRKPKASTNTGPSTEEG